MDNFIEVDKKDLNKVVKWLCVGSIMFAVEPWPDSVWRIYVKKDAADTLAIMEEELKK
jgi:hypothetical protein